MHGGVTFSSANPEHLPQALSEYNTKKDFFNGQEYIFLYGEMKI